VNTAAAAAIRAAGLRLTRPRRLVLEMLAELGGHNSADDVACAIATGGEHLSRMSVYNALEALSGVGLVSVVDAGPGAARYEVAGPTHHHFVCRSCGVVLDVDPVPREPRWLELDVPGAHVDAAEVVLRGLCDLCAATTTPDPNVR
jgi:Fe2+ or Zn2+ uptake regulation protein